MNIERHKEELEFTGFTIIEDVFSKSQIEKMSQKYDQCIEQYEADFNPARINENERGTMRLFLYEEFLPIIDAPAVKTVANAVMGDFNFYSISGIYSSSRFTNPTTVFHRDSYILSSNTVLSLNLMYLLDDVHGQNGATWYLPGSHRYTKRPTDEFIEKNKIQMIAPAGSAVLFDSLLYHGCGENFTHKDRRNFACVIKKPYLKPAFNFDQALDPSLISVLTEDQKTLLGFYSRPRNSLDEYLQEGVRRRDERIKAGVKTIYGIELKD